jgi:subfamily B ATP-binding cassette protein HlyB/CyaB
MNAPALLGTIAPESVIWMFEAVSRETGRPFSRAVTLQACPPPHDMCSVHRALSEFGFDCMLVQGAVSMCDADDLWFALIDEGARPRRDGDTPTSHESSAPLLQLVQLHASRDGRSHHVSDHRSAAPTAMAPESFQEVYAGHSLRVRRKPIEVVPEPDPGMSVDRFGFAWFGREMRRYRKVWVEVLFAALCIQLLALTVPLLTQAVIDKVMTHRTANTLIVIAVAFLFATIFSGLLAWLRQYFVLHAGTRIDAVLASDVFSHLLHLPARYFEQRPTGVLVARMQAVETVREFLTGAALTLVLDLPFMLIFAAIMYHYSPTLTWVAVSFLGLILLLSALGTPALRRAIDAQFLSGARQQAFITERLAGMETVKSLQLEGVLGQRFESLYGVYLRTGLRTRLLSAGIGLGAQTVEQLLTVSVLCVGAWMVIEGGAMTVGALVAFQMFASRLTAPALKIAGLWQEFQQVYVAVRRLADIMDSPREPMRGEGMRAAGGVAWLQCADLGFRYLDGPWVFRGLSFELKPGGCAAIVGPSGSGKSTLVRLLLGFYLPEEGAIRIDGANTAALAANEVRAYLGVVPQETRLFTGSILQNLLDAAPGATFEEVVSSCRAAGIHDVIQAMPAAYLSRIGENGTGLSGGQKQRLAIARALLKGARILVFDEAMSSLDPDLADAFVGTINGLRGRVSVIFIGHRLPERLQPDVVVDMANCRGRRQ